MVNPLQALRTLKHTKGLWPLGVPDKHIGMALRNTHEPPRQSITTGSCKLFFRDPRSPKAELFIDSRVHS